MATALSISTTASTQNLYPDEVSTMGPFGNDPLPPGYDHRPRAERRGKENTGSKYKRGRWWDKK
jgi:hypothetical protein